MVVEVPQRERQGVEQHSQVEQVANRAVLLGPQQAYIQQRDGYRGHAVVHLETRSAGGRNIKSQ